MTLSEEEDLKTCAILRLLNGPLCGCEYRLPPGATLIISGSEASLLGGDDAACIPDFPENSLVFPMADVGNFELVIGSHADDQFLLRILGERIEERVCEFQCECRVGSLLFSVRPEGVDWDAAGTAADAGTIAGPVRSSWRKYGLFCALGILAVLLAGLLSWKIVGDNRDVLEVSEIVAGSTVPLRLCKGSDSIVYVFAENSRDMLWARQALTRRERQLSARVLARGEEEERIGKLLLAAYPELSFYRVDLSDPEKPKLWMSRERGYLDAVEWKTIDANLLKWMPYAEKILTAHWSDQVLDRHAMAGLDRLRVEYQRRPHAHGVTYRIAGDLSDVDLANLRSFIDGFYREFGRRYINFSVDLTEDRFKGKSFKYGHLGYVKMTSQHWFFSQMF